MRRLYPLILLALVAGCGGTVVSETFDEVGEPLPTPATGDASVEPSAAAGDEGTIVLEEGAIADGPGESIADALAHSAGEPTLVNGSLMLDTDGSIWLCDVVEPYNPPQCVWPRLRVDNFPEGTATFDMTSADLTGAQEQDGVVWLEDHQLFGTIQP